MTAFVMKLLLVLVSMGLFLETVSAQTQTQTYTLDALTTAAEAHYPGLRAAAQAIEAAEARLQEAKVSPFMQFEARGAFSVAPSAQGTPIFSPDSQLPLGNPWRPVMGVEISGAVPVFTFGKLRYLRGAARQGIRAAEFDREHQKNQLRYQVRRAFFGLQLALDTLQMISEGESKLQEALSVLEEKLEQDDPDVNPADRYRLASALAEIIARRSETTRLAATSRAALALLTGIHALRIPECPIAPLDVHPDALAAYQTSGHARPELGMLGAAIHARELQLAGFRSHYFPDIALALRAAYSWSPGVTDIQNPFIQDSANSQALSAGLVFRWSLDFWGNRHRVRRAQALVEVVQAQREEAEIGIAIEITDAYEAVMDAKRRSDAWQRGERETRAWFVASAQGYEVGTTEPSELVDAIKSYFTARFSHLDAVRQYNTAIARLELVANKTMLPNAAWGQRCE